jgi:hypothetical protein
MSITIYTTLSAAQAAVSQAQAAGQAADMVLGNGEITVRTDADCSPGPTPAGQAAQALAAGLSITSTSTPAVSGVYAVGPNAQARLTQVMTYVQTFGAFPKGASSLPWLLADGQSVVLIPSVAVFKAIAQACADYAYELDEYANGAPGTSLPGSSVTVA